MEHSDSFDDSWHTSAPRWTDICEDFAEAFAEVTDGLIAATPDDLERAISAARLVAVAKYKAQGDQDDGQP